MALVQTRAAALRGAGGEMQVVRFEAHKPRPRAAGQAGRAGAGQAARAAPAPPADLKRIRHEVVRLGMSGFDAPRKEEARVALAVSLGAKPPKKEYKNYKELMAQRKDEKTKEKERRELFGKDLMRSSVTPKMKKTSTKGNDVGHLLTVYGKQHIDELPLDRYSSDNEMCLKLDGAPPHHALPVRQHLNSRFPGRWIGRGGRVTAAAAWPAKISRPSLTLCFYGAL